MVDPGDKTRLHQSDWVTDRVTQALNDAIVGGVDKAWSLVAANTMGHNRLMHRSKHQAGPFPQSVREKPKLRHNPFSGPVDRKGRLTF